MRGITRTPRPLISSGHTVLEPPVAVSLLNYEFPKRLEPGFSPSLISSRIRHLLNVY